MPGARSSCELLDAASTGARRNVVGFTSFSDDGSASGDRGGTLSKVLRDEDTAKGSSRSDLRGKSPPSPTFVEVLSPTSQRQKTTRGKHLQYLSCKSSISGVGLLSRKLAKSGPCDAGAENGDANSRRRHTAEPRTTDFIWRQTQEHQTNNQSDGTERLPRKMTQQDGGQQLRSSPAAEEQAQRLFRTVATLHPRSMAAKQVGNLENLETRRMPNTRKAI